MTMWHAKSPVQVRQWSWCSLRKCTLAALAHVFCLCSVLSRNTLKSQAAPKSPCTPHKNTCSSNPLTLHPGKNININICKRLFPMLPWKKRVHDSCTTWTPRVPAMQRRKPLQLALGLRLAFTRAGNCACGSPAEHSLTTSGQETSLASSASAHRYLSKIYPKSTRICPSLMSCDLYAKKGILLTSGAQQSLIKSRSPSCASKACLQH